MGWNQNGMISSPIIHFLELAVDLGLAPKLEQELRARADKKGPSSVGLIDQDRDDVHPPGHPGARFRRTGPMWKKC